MNEYIIILPATNQFIPTPIAVFADTISYDDETGQVLFYSKSDELLAVAPKEALVKKQS